MYHWRDVTTSRGLSPFSKKFTGCVIFFGSPSSRSGRGEELHHRFLGAEDGLARDGGVRFTAGVGGDPLRGLGDDAAVAAHDGARGKLQFTPPGDVGQVAEGADHGDAGALVRLGQRVGLDLKLDVEQRGT